MPPGHIRLGISQHAMMLQLNLFLQEKLVREVQSLKAGFAICPASNAAHETLVAKTNDMETFLSTEGECKVKKPI